MKILFFTDVHLRSASDRPKWRVDDHYKTQFTELYEINEIARSNKVDVMISIGDLFDHTRVSHQLVTDVLKWTKLVPCPTYSVVGNHDVNAYVTTDRNNGLGVLFESGAIGQLSDDLIFDKEKVVIRGVNVFLDPRQGNYMFDEKYNSYCTIVASHNFIIPEDVIFDAVKPKDVKTNANVIALGHYHKTFNVYENKTAFINPGSISRWAVNEQHQPQVFIVDTTNGVISAVQLKTSLLPSEIFDLTAAAEMKSAEMNLQTFVDSLENTSFDNIDIENVILTEGTKQGITREIVDMALTKVRTAKEELR